MDEMNQPHPFAMRPVFAERWARHARNLVPAAHWPQARGLGVPDGDDLPWLPNAVVCVCVVIAIFTYALLTSAVDRELDLWALAFQLACWGGGLSLLAARHPRGQLRFSDPAVLVALWSGLYLLLPSVLWVQSATVPYDGDLVGQVPARLFVLHGLFMLAFFGSYALLVSADCYVVDRVRFDQLVSGWPLFLISFVPLFVTVALRILATGSILPVQNYADEYFASYDSILSARQSGVIEYLLVQIGSRVDFYPLLAAGIGGGLVLSRANLRGKGFARSLTLVLFGVVAILFLSNAGRHLAFMVLLIGLVVADALAGPIRWKILATYLPLALLLFEFMGFFRAYRSLDFEQGLAQGYQEFAAADGSSDRMFEYTLMLGKEAAGLRVFDQPQGLDQVIGETLAVVPSQLNPAKLQWLNTAEVLSHDLLGDFADKGAGVAGSMIADAYRAGGVLGVTTFGALLGLALAGLQRWGAAGTRLGQAGPVLLRLLLVCGFYGWTFDVIRGDMTGLLSALLYNVALVWIVASRVAGKQSVWLARVAYQEQGGTNQSNAPGED
jgi:hypothetical protein